MYKKKTFTTTRHIMIKQVKTIEKDKVVCTKKNNSSRKEVEEKMEDLKEDV